METELQGHISSAIQKTHKDYDAQKAKRQSIRDQNQKDLAEYEKQREEYEKQVQQLEEEKRVEQQNQAEIKAEQQRIEQQKQTIQEKYQSEIDELVKYRTQRSGRTRRVYYYVTVKGRRVRKAKQVTPYGYSPLSQSQIRNINGKIRVLENKRKSELARFNLALSPLPQWVKTKASREWSPSTHSKTSLVSLAQRYYDSYLAESERKRQSSITTARSNTVKAQEKLDKVVQSYEMKKLQMPSPVRKSSGTITQTRPLTKATKRKPRTHVSTKPYVTMRKPSDILGNTQQSSNIAVLTFQDIQHNQKKLFEKITNAKSAYEADRIRASTMKKNPALGTFNEFYLNNVKVRTSGFLAEKILTSVIPPKGKTKPDILPEPKVTAQSTNHIVPKLSLPTAKEILSKPHGISQNMPKPFAKNEPYYFGGTGGFFKYQQINPHNTNHKEAVRIAGGRYGDYLKTIPKDTLDYHLKNIGLGAKRGFNTYTSLAGVNLINPKTHGRSLIDLAITDIYNSVYHPVIKPHKLTLESWGIKVTPAPTNPKPFELTSKAYNKRTPAENFGDIVTVGAVEAGLFVSTGGIGNLAIRGASKLPYLLKHVPKIPKQVIDSSKSQTPTKMVNVPGMGKVKLTDFDYVEPVMISTRTKKPRTATSTKFGRWIAKHTPQYKDVLPDIKPKTTNTKKPRIATSTKFGRWLAKHTPQYKDVLSDKTTKSTRTKKPKSFHSKFINSKLGITLGQSKILNPKKPDKGVKFAEGGLDCNRANSDNFKSLPSPSKTAKIKSQYELVQKPSTTKKTIKNTTKNTNKKKSKGNAEYDVYQFADNVTNIKSLIGFTAKSLNFDVTPKISSRITEKLDFKLSDKSLLKNTIKTDVTPTTTYKDKPKDRSKNSLRYGLKFKGAEETKTVTDMGLIFLNPPKQIQRPSMTTTKITRIRRPPVTPLRLKKNNDRIVKPFKVKKYRKGALKFSVWNVGVYTKGNIKGAELRTSKSFKLFEDFDKLEQQQAKREKSKTRKSTAKKKSTNSTKKKKPVRTTRNKTPTKTTKRKSTKRSGKRR